MEREVKCPWCGESVIPIDSDYSGQYGEMREKRCPKCRKLVSVRLKERK
jgi:endogenous inhibitor of DNA gyrase (YacG/DUF329 family)